MEIESVRPISRAAPRKAREKAPQAAKKAPQAGEKAPQAGKKSPQAPKKKKGRETPEEPFSPVQSESELSTTPPKKTKREPKKPRPQAKAEQQVLSDVSSELTAASEDEREEESPPSFQVQRKSRTKSVTKLQPKIQPEPKSKRKTGHVSISESTPTSEPDEEEPEDRAKPKPVLEVVQTQPPRPSSPQPDRTSTKKRPEKKTEEVKFLKEAKPASRAKPKQKPPAAIGGGDETYPEKIRDQRILTSSCRHPKTYAELMSLRMPPQRNAQTQNWPTQSFKVPPPCPEPQPPCGETDGFIKPVDILCNPYYIYGSEWQHGHPCYQSMDEMQRQQQCLQWCGNNFVLAMNYQKNNSNNNPQGSLEYLSDTARPTFTCEADCNILNTVGDADNGKQVMTRLPSSSENTFNISDVRALPDSNQNINNASPDSVSDVLPEFSRNMRDAKEAAGSTMTKSPSDDREPSNLEAEWEEFTLLRQGSTAGPERQVNK